MCAWMKCRSFPLTLRLCLGLRSRRIVTTGVYQNIGFWPPAFITVSVLLEDPGVYLGPGF